MVELLFIVLSELMLSKGFWFFFLDILLVNIGYILMIYLYSFNDVVVVDFFDVGSFNKVMVKVLVFFYFFVGCFGNNSDNGSMEISCNGEGVFFVVVYVDDEFIIDDVKNLKLLLELSSLFVLCIELLFVMLVI